MLLSLENEVDPDARYLGDALRSLLGEHATYDYVREGGRPALDRFDDLDGVVVGGSTAGVYEADDHPWMAEEAAFVRELVDREIPVLGVCFGHQLVNEALGGRVEHHGLAHRLVTADLADDPLFDGVNRTIPAVHGDRVVDPGDGMAPIAATDDYRYFATRHRDAPVWTVQYHPEFQHDLLARIREDFGWTDTDRSWADVTTARTLRNFERLAAAHSR
ncbi:type 1 glutamine amidotransferase [Haloarchaeobius amylolyticus]|uniref:type 1 glutamine amidotransferase n=1 Tax=Haloarchaeobius amylolyticus TaxID=1198296 RepID=UPI00227009AF|nr:type 1 glutamine amidotransferase [Haloarchaeobius amylolyticus]